MDVVRRAEWLVERPWRLVAVVTIAIALPILLLGEVSNAETRARDAAADTDAARRAAVTVRDTVAARLSGMERAVENAAVRPVSGKATPLIDAVERHDSTAMQASLDAIWPYMDPSVQRLTLVDESARIVATTPFVRTLIGADARGPGAPLGLERPQIGNAVLAYAIGSGPNTGSSPSEVSVGAGAPVGATAPKGYRLFAVADLRQLAGDELGALSAAYQDVYLVDAAGHLGLRATHAHTTDELWLRDLHDTVAFASVANPTAPADIPDPLDPSRRLRASARMPDIGWSVMVLDPRGSSNALDASLAQQRALRFGLVAVLMLGAVLVGGASSAALRRRREVQEALERQTATSSVLRAISQAHEDAQPVLQTIVDEARRLCAADNAGFYRREGNEIMLLATSGDWKQAGPVTRHSLDNEWPITRAVRDRRSYQVENADPANPLAAWARCRLAVPVIRGDDVLGVIRVGRMRAGGFTARHVEIVESFAAQAAIAIENVRLFNQTNEALKRQTAISDVLRTISQTVFDLGTTIEAVVGNAGRLASADLAWMMVDDGSSLRIAAWVADPELANRLPGASFRGGTWSGTLPPRGADQHSLMDRIYQDGHARNIADVTLDEDLLAQSGTLRKTASRSVLGVPVRGEAGVLGVFVVARVTVRPFDDREVQLVETFADQAAIAIQNVRLFNEVQEKSRQLEIANRHKSEFLANMSHELRTPLNAIIGFSEVLVQGIFGQTNEKQREYLEDVLGSGKHLLSLINDILDLSKIEAGRMELELSTFPLVQVLDSALTVVRERASRHGIALQATLPTDLPPIEADERKVKQILYNLLSNAVKFTPDGGTIEVRVGRADEDVRVEVADTGIGIASADQGKVFEEFRQVGRERAREGTGLGLTLTKRFVELHGGRIWLESAPGVGSTFFFTLPLRHAAEVTA